MSFDLNLNLNLNVELKGRAQMASEIFQKIASGKPTVGGNYINPGKYLFEVLNLMAEKKFKGNTFIAEFRVLEAVQTDPNKLPNAVGTTCSYVVKLDDPEGMGYGNVLAFAMGFLNEPAENVQGPAGAERLSFMCGADQPFKYFQVRDEAYLKPMKKNPAQMFTHHRWEHVEPTEDFIKAVVARREAEKKTPVAAAK